MLKQWSARALIVCLVASATFVPAKSHAWLIGMALGTIVTGNPTPPARTADAFAMEFVACMVLLPICVLDGGTTEAGAARPAELAANGYTPREIAQIVAGQAELRARLGERGLRLAPDGHDDRTSLEAAVRTVYPTASAVYLNFLAEATGSAPR